MTVELYLLWGADLKKAFLTSTAGDRTDGDLKIGLITQFETCDFEKDNLSTVIGSMESERDEHSVLMSQRLGALYPA